MLVLLIAIPSSVVTSLYTVLFSVQERTGQVLVYMFLMTLANISVSIALIPTLGALGAALGTVLSNGVAQACYIWDQHRRFGVRAERIWCLWAAGLALGAGQFVAGPRPAMRMVWAVVATTVLAGIVRTVGCVDARLVDRLFAGQLNAVGGMINRVLVAKT
jgi:O-antigen/teichoic acid export membrane protein